MRRNPPTRPIKDVALALLARRDHTRVELTRKLRARAYALHDIEELLSRLAELGLIDDRKTARLLMEHELSRHPAGSIMLRAKLAAKGVAPEVINECLASLADGWELDQARLAAARWRARHPHDAVDRAGLARHLRGRGFPWETVRNVIDSANVDDEWRISLHDES